MDAMTSNSGPTGAVGSSFSRSHFALPGPGRPPQTGPGTKLSRKALPYQQQSAAVKNPNGYNPAQPAAAGKNPQYGNGNGRGWFANHGGNGNGGYNDGNNNRG